jgi:hypothetical protein
LQLEILESSTLGDYNAVSKIIDICKKEIGVDTALDDFGTGYSSLTHLRNLPVSTLKVDQTFIRDMLDNPSDYAIVDGVISLADSFNLQVIAEGVETTAHGVILLLMQCEHAQGYGIAKPMPADKFYEWLNEYQPNQVWLTHGEKNYSPKERKLILFKVISNHWKDNFVNILQNSSSRVQCYPLIDLDHSYVNDWLRRTQQTQLFAKLWLQKLESLHHEAFIIADRLLNQYQQGELESINVQLSEFNTKFDEINHAIDALLN